MFQLDTGKLLRLPAGGRAQFCAQYRPLRSGGGIALHDRNQIGIIDLAMFVGGSLELGKDPAQLLGRGRIAQLGQALGQGVLARMLAQNQGRARSAHAFRGHDLVGAAVGQHAVLVDAGLVREGILADDCLVRRHGGAGDARQALAGRPDMGGVGMADGREDVGPHLQGHDDFFHRAIAGPLTDAIERTLDLAGAGLHGGQRVGDGQSQIIVAMG